MTARAQTVTILFTDLVGSTELLQRAGDEKAQHIFKAHHRLLREAVEAHGGHEVKWLGDGLMVAFDSTRDAVKCAIAMQQSSRRPTAGERLEIRAGINVGEVHVDESDYFGTPVVVARRLCDRAGGGQIFASDIVARLLDGHGADLSTKDLGPLDLKGITNAVPAVEIVYEHDPMALLRKLPFVGRQAEYETLTTKLAEARKGRGAVALLAGEPGVGKTRLTEGFCDRAATGAMVIRGNCYEGDVAAPFGPWTEALRSLIEQLSDGDLRDALGPGAVALAAMLPEIRRRLPDVDDAPRLDPESERARLFEGVGAFLRNVADERPLVIFLDDLHWCDRPSLALLEQVARGIADRRIVIVGTYRDVEVDRVHPLAPTLAALRRMEHHDRIAVRGFTVESVNELLSAIEPAEATASDRQALAQVLHDESEGNPFFIREVLNNLVETGKLVQRDGAWVGVVDSIEAMGIPDGIKEVIGRRLSRLSDGCNRMLQRASAMTSGFTWEELRAFSEDSEDDLLDYLDEALGSQLLEERQKTAYVFTHALVRATLYDELSGPRRVMLHRRVAETLELLYADDLDSHLGELAAHFLAAAGGEVRKAIEYSVRAGARAMELLAWEESAAHYECALQAMSLAKVPPNEDRCRALLALVDCNHLSGRFPPNIDLLREAAGIARALPSADLLSLVAMAFENAAQKEESGMGAERLALLDEALAMLEGEETARRAHTLCHRVRAAAAFANERAGLSAVGFFAWAGERDEAVLRQAQEAVALAEAVGDHYVTAIAIIYLHNYDWRPDNDRERLALLERGLESARKAQSSRAEYELRAAQSAGLLAVGDIEEFRRNAERQRLLLDRLHYEAEMYTTTAFQVVLEIGEGRFADAEQHLTGYSSGASPVTLAVTAVGQLYVLRYAQGRLAELVDMWRGIVATRPGLAIMRAALIFACATNGNQAEARADVEQFVRRGFKAVPRDFMWRGTLALLAEACVEIEHREGAAALSEELLPHAAMNAAAANIIDFGSTARFLGRLSTLLERWDEAEQHFEMALEANARMGYVAWVALTQLNYGRMLLRRGRPGDRDRAIALLREALAFAREAGMGQVQADSERLLSAHA